MRNNLADIVKVNIQIEEPVSNSASFNNMLIVGPQPEIVDCKKASKVEDCYVCTSYDSLCYIFREICGVSENYDVELLKGTDVLKAAAVAFSQSVPPTKVYVAFNKSNATIGECGILGFSNEYELKSVFPNCRAEITYPCIVLKYNTASDTGYITTVSMKRDGSSIQPYDVVIERNDDDGYNYALYEVEAGTFTAEAEITSTYLDSSGNAQTSKVVVSNGICISTNDCKIGDETTITDFPNETIQNTINKALNTNGWYVVCPTYTDPDVIYRIDEIISAETISKKIMAYSVFGNVRDESENYGTHKKNSDGSPMMRAKNAVSVNYSYASGDVTLNSAPASGKNAVVLYRDNNGETAEVLHGNGNDVTIPIGDGKVIISVTVGDALEVSQIEKYSTNDLVTNKSLRAFGIYGGTSYPQTVENIASTADSDNRFIHIAWTALCLNYTPGAETWALKTLVGIQPCDISSNNMQYLKNYNVSYYTTYAERDVTQGGKVAYGEWIDVIRFRDWLENDMQTRIFNTLVKYPKVPYTDDGIALVKNQMIASLKQGQLNGGIAPTEFDSEDNEIPGFVVSVPLAAEITDIQKKSRILSDCKFRARLAGAIHVVEVDGVLAYDMAAQ